jgi:uncharacterized phage protein (TIGR02220 family)
MHGWIKLHRKIANSWIFKNSDNLKAWITILLNVNHEQSKVLIKNTLFDCYPGESLKSLDTWAQLFGRWSKSRVLRFFNLLKKDKMIETHNETITTRIRVCNWDTYQHDRNASDTATETQAKRKRNASDTQTRMNKKDIEYIISFLNSTVGTNFKTNSEKTNRHINARLDEGYLLPDFELVIKHKNYLWKGTEQEQYLRPETLFGTKFEGYLQAAKIALKKKQTGTRIIQ